MNEPAATTQGEEAHIADIHIAGQAPYRLFLLPGDTDEVTHEEATAWAAEKGGTLPNRFEQALLFAHHKDAFEKKDWYWSDAQHASNADFAWCQGFSNGTQRNRHRLYRLRARAVRRLPI